MRIFTFQAGLGNQLFQYTYYRYLTQKYPDETFYGFYPKRGLSKHNGLEITKWFDVSLPPVTRLTNILAKSLFWGDKLFYRINKQPPFTDNDWYHRPDSLFYQGYWQDKKYLLAVGKPLYRHDLVLDNNNKKYLDLIQSTNSVAVHVRRGDYTDPKVQRIYGGIGTPEFYQKALAIIKSKVENPHFFFFSDDTDYVKSNFHEPSMEIVNCNSGSKSFFDMYLMSKCKNMVIPNSTFSCWAAYLNDNNPIVVCPAKWRNDKPSPKVILDSWVTI